MKACFMGLGYIGLPTAIIAAEHGIEVIGVDINPQVVDMTNQYCGTRFTGIMPESSNVRPSEGFGKAGNK